MSRKRQLALKRLATWRCWGYDSVLEWLDFARKLWDRADDWPEPTVADYYVIAVSRSGSAENAAVIAAMMKNGDMWRSAYKANFYGHHWIFEKPDHIRNTAESQAQLRAALKPWIGLRWGSSATGCDSCHGDFLLTEANR